MSNNRSNELERLAAAFAALANPQRLRMFVTLATRCCAPASPTAARQRARFCCAGEVGRGLGLAASTVSHHLKELRQAGLMHVERQGRRIDCWASQETLGLLATFIASLAGRKGRPPAREAALLSASGGPR